MLTPGAEAQIYFPAVNALLACASSSSARLRGRATFRDTLEGFPHRLADFWLQAFLDRCNRFFQRVYRYVGFIFCDDERRGDAHCAGTAAEEKDSALEG